jgi:hypothetical protein
MPNPHKQPSAYVIRKKRSQSFKNHQRPLNLTQRQQFASPKKCFTHLRKAKTGAGCVVGEGTSDERPMVAQSLDREDRIAGSCRALGRP